jgi:hypothetical protein
MIKARLYKKASSKAIREMLLFSSSIRTFIAEYG